MTLRPEEQFVADKLTERFGRISGLVTFSCAEGADPPDLVCQVNQQRWGVEVTRLQQLTTRRRQPATRADVEEPLLKMCKQITDQVKDQTNRHYIISATGDIGMPWKEVVRRAVEHIREGKTEDNDLGTYGYVRVICEVAPVRISYLTGLDPLAEDPKGRLVTDIETSVRDALESRLKAKLPKLRRLEGYDGKALVLLREHFLAEPSMVRNILNDGDFTIDGESLSSDDLDQILFITEQGEIDFVWGGGKSFV